MKTDNVTTTIRLAGAILAVIVFLSATPSTHAADCEVKCKDGFFQNSIQTSRENCNDQCKSFCDDRNQEVGWCIYKGVIVKSNPTLPVWGLIGLGALTAIGGAVIVGRRRVATTRAA